GRAARPADVALEARLRLLDVDVEDLVEIGIEQVQRQVLREHGGPAARRNAAVEAGQLAAHVEAADDAAAGRLAARSGRHRDPCRDVDRRGRRAVEGEGAQLEGEVENV